MFIFLSKSRGLQPWKKVAMGSGACSWATSNFNARASTKHLSPTPNPHQRSRDLEVRSIIVVIRACYQKVNNSTFISILFFSCLQANIMELHLSTPCLKEKRPNILDRGVPGLTAAWCPGTPEPTLANNDEFVSLRLRGVRKSGSQEVVRRF